MPGLIARAHRGAATCSGQGTERFLGKQRWWIQRKIHLQIYKHCCRITCFFWDDVLILFGRNAYTDTSIYIYIWYIVYIYISMKRSKDNRRYIKSQSIAGEIFQSSLRRRRIVGTHLWEVPTDWNGTAGFVPARNARLINMDQYGSIWINMDQYGSIWINDMLYFVETPWQLTHQCFGLVHIWSDNHKYLLISTWTHHEFRKSCLLESLLKIHRLYGRWSLRSEILRKTHHDSQNFHGFPLKLKIHLGCFFQK